MPHFGQQGMALSRGGGRIGVVRVIVDDILFESFGDWDKRPEKKEESVVSPAVVDLNICSLCFRRRWRYVLAG